jgi:hypothetical protein
MMNCSTDTVAGIACKLRISPRALAETASAEDSRDYCPDAFALAAFIKGQSTLRS